MNATCDGTGTYPEAMALVNAINQIDGRTNVEANITVGGVNVWLKEASFLPQVANTCKEFGVTPRSEATAAMEEVILQNPSNWGRYSESASNGNAVINEWIV